MNLKLLRHHPHRNDVVEYHSSFTNKSKNTGKFIVTYARTTYLRPNRRFGCNLKDLFSRD